MSGQSTVPELMELVKADVRQERQSPETWLRLVAAILQLHERLSEREAADRRKSGKVKKR